jgi:hypothetical protein
VQAVNWSRYANEDSHINTGLATAADMLLLIHSKFAAATRPLRLVCMLTAVDAAVFTPRQRSSAAQALLPAHLLKEICMLGPQPCIEQQHLCQAGRLLLLKSRQQLNLQQQRWQQVQ